MERSGHNRRQDLLPLSRLEMALPKAPTGITGKSGGKMFGIQPALDGAVRPRAGLGIKIDRPKMPKIDAGVHYVMPHIAHKV